MKRLSGIDAGFLAMETPNMYLHVVGILIVDPSTAPQGATADDLRRTFAERLHMMPPFLVRVLEVPFGLAAPVFVEDPDFDVDDHIRVTTLASPGGRSELQDFVGDFASRPLERDRPLWDAVIVDGLEDGRIAIVTKMHHSLMDGGAGAALMGSLFDLAPDAEAPPAPEEPWAPDPIPSSVDLLRDSAGLIATAPLRLAGPLTRFAQGLAVSGTRRISDDDAGPIPFTSPPTPLNGSLTPNRSVSVGAASFSDVRKVKDAFGVTVNDVVLAAAAGSLRQWLVAHDSLPPDPLVAFIPVGERSDEPASITGNMVTGLLARLPTHLTDPVARMGAAHAEVAHARKLHGTTLGIDTLSGIADATAPAITSGFMHAYCASHLADRHAPLHNVIVSNVMGPPVPLYFAGARIEATYPMGPVFEGSGLNLTVLSDMGNLDVGALACREMVPDLDDIVDGFNDAVEELVALADKRT